MDEDRDGGISDGELIRLSMEDPERFGEIFERHVSVLNRFLVTRVGIVSAEDALSSVFVIAFESRNRFKVEAKDARPWLFGIAANVVRHHYRSEGRRMAAIGRIRSEAERHQENVDAVFSDGRGELGDVRWALERIDERYRDVLVLAAGPGLTYEEISEALNVPVGTVRSRLSRGRAQLRELLGGGGQLDMSEQGRCHSSAGRRRS